MTPSNQSNFNTIFGFMCDENGKLPEGFKEFSECFDELNDEMVELFVASPIFPKRQMGTLKGKIKIPDNFDTAFADEIGDMFENDELI